MSLTTQGAAPGPVRFSLLCDRGGCATRTQFDLVIAESGPSLDDDLMGHLLHSARAAAPYIAELGWTFRQGVGYWCPGCSGPERRPRTIAGAG